MKCKQGFDVSSQACFFNEITNWKGLEVKKMDSADFFFYFETLWLKEQQVDQKNLQFI